jgi:glucuronate isomerase
MNHHYIDDNFLLANEYARTLYHSYAGSMPIIDYHCHLSPKDIAEDRQFKNLTEIWLNGDHYKWRAMRACGVDEQFITGGGSDWEKFEKWAETVPKTLRNPLYHWTHLELKKPFGIVDRLLDKSTARGIWDECNAKFATPGFSARGILKQMNVEIVCTTDDPTDTLEFHKKIQSDGSCRTQVYPTFRPDKAMAVENPATFASYVGLLSRAADLEIRNVAEFLTALRKRHDCAATAAAVDRRSSAKRAPPDRIKRLVLSRIDSPSSLRSRSAAFRPEGR